MHCSESRSVDSSQRLQVVIPIGFRAGAIGPVDGRHRFWIEYGKLVRPWKDIQNRDRA